MKLFRSALTLIILVGFIKPTMAQRNLLLESVQVYSNILPNANYYRPDSTALQSLLNAFEIGIAQKLNYQIDKKELPKLIVLNKVNQLGKINIDWSKSAQFPYHGYIELYEMDPDFVFKNSLLDSIAPEKKDSIKSIWFLTCTVVNQQKEIAFKKTLLLQIIPNHTSGIGIPLNYPTTLPENIFKAIAKSIEIITQHEDLELLNAKAPSCFATDNFIMPYVHNADRIKIDTSKNSIQYTNQNNKEIVRIPNAITQKINLRDKSLNNPLSSVIPVLKSKSEGSGEFYHIVQPLRDVRNNIDYHIESFIQLNTRMDESNSPVIFIADSSLHGLYENNKLVSYLKINENVQEKDAWFNTNIVYNGYDSSEKYNIATSFQKGKAVFEKSIEGKLEGTSFKILFHQASATKLIYYNNQLAIILDGEKLPTQFVLVNKNLPNKLINLLTLIGYSEIFQNHSVKN